MSASSRVQIRRRRPRRGHPRELRELVDERLERLDFPDDRRRAFLDERAGGGRRRRELPAHSLGAQLNRGQRILDLVRQAARHVAPRRHPLRPDERRHIVEHENRAANAAVVAQERRRRRSQMQLAAVAQPARFPARRRRIRPPRLLQQDLERLEILAREDVLGPAPMTERSTSSSRSAAPLIVSICPSAPSETTPVAIRSSTVSM